jgi:hypothetical protein
MAKFPTSWIFSVSGTFRVSVKDFATPGHFRRCVSTWDILAGQRPSSSARTDLRPSPRMHQQHGPKPRIFPSWCCLSRISRAIQARIISFTFKGKNIDSKEISKELGVRYVLEGSVQRDQNHVRVNAQLIDGKTGAHLWADRFEESITDLFKLQQHGLLHASFRCISPKKDVRWVGLHAGGHLFQLIRRSGQRMQCFPEPLKISYPTERVTSICGRLRAGAKLIAAEDRVGETDERLLRVRNF